jgi:hypothetical protein
MQKLALALLTGSFVLFAADELPKAEVILDHYIEVTGGKAAYEKRHSQISTGTMELVGKGIKGTFASYALAPDKLYFVIDIEGIGKIESGSNGAVAWESSAMQGPHVKQGDELADALLEGAFNARLNWRKLYVKVETAGSETVDGHDCYKVVLTPKEGKPSAEFYDKKSGLILKETATRTTSMGEVSAEVDVGPYKDADGVLEPATVTNKFAGQEIRLSFDKVQTNVEIAANRFDLPPDIHALLKKAAPAAQTQSAASAPPAPGDLGGKLAVYMNGKPFGSETYTLKKSADKVELDGSGSATLGTMKISIDQFKVVTDGAFHPIEADAKAKLGQIPIGTKTLFADGKAKNEITNGQGTQNKEDDAHPDTLVVNANIPLYPWSLLALRVNLSATDPQLFPVYVLGQAEVTATVTAKGSESVEFAGGKKADLSHYQVNAKTPQGQAETLDFWVDGARRLIKISVPTQNVEAYQDGYDPLPAPAKPAEPPSKQ